LGSNEQMEPADNQSRKLSSIQGLIALAAVLALGIGLTVFFSSAPAEKIHDVPQEMVNEEGSKTTAEKSATQKPGASKAPPKTSEDNQNRPSEAERDTLAPRNAASSERSNEEKTADRRIRVVFESEPSGAKVFRNGEAFGDKETPFSMEVLPSKLEATYTFQKRGFTTVKQEVGSKVDGDRLEIKAALKRAKVPKKRTRPSNLLRRRER